MTVIDIGGINLWLVQTDVSEVEGIKVPVLADRNDTVGDRDEMIIEAMGQIVYETASGAIDDCTGLLKPLTQYESQTLAGATHELAFHSRRPAYSEVQGTRG